MVEGQPLHYRYNPYASPRSQEDFPYFRQFEQYYPPSMESYEELVMPLSPNSAQSDSDNSVSSIEVPSKQIHKTDEKTEVRCCWTACGVLFPSLDRLAVHVSKVHASSGPGGLFYCGWEGCGRNNKGFNARYKMLVHVRTHTNEKPHRCSQCAKSFSRAENLKIHSRSHSGEKPYVCPVPGCNKAYSNSSDRFKHTRTHSVEKPYQCKVAGCPKRYTDPSSLRKHVKTYKHFVNENSITENPKIDERTIGAYEEQSNVPVTPMSEERIAASPAFEVRERHENVIRHPCNCNRLACVPNCGKSPDILRFGHLINFEHEENMIGGWNGFLDIEPKKLYKPYEITNESMDMDTPLDLSINRRGNI